MVANKRQLYTNEELKLALLEQKNIQIDGSLKDIKETLSLLSIKLDAINTAFNEIKDNFKDIRLESKSHFKWTMGFFLSILTSLLLKTLHF